MLARNVQCYLLLLARTVQQSQRAALPPLLVYINLEIPFTTAQRGHFISAIAAGYFFTQLPGGALADYIGAKNIMTIAMLLSSLCCIMMPFVADTMGIAGLWGLNAFMGAVQGPLFPVSTVFLSRWLPSKVDGQIDEKAWGTSMLDIGISVGAFIIVPLAGTIAGTWGWRWAYSVIGMVGIAFVALWQWLGAEEPQRCSYISKDELIFLSKHITKPSLKKPIEAHSQGGGFLGMPYPLLKNSGLWAIFVAHMAFNYGAYFITNWSPIYYSEVFDLKPDEAKWYLAMPHVTNLVCKSLNPSLVALVDRQGIGLLPSRRLFTAAGFLLSAATILPMYGLRTFGPSVTMVIFSVANAFFGMAPVGFKSNYLDITERYVGVVSGIGNTLGTGASYVGPIFVAHVLQSFGGWAAALASIAAVNILATVNFVRHAQVVPIERQSFEFIGGYPSGQSVKPDAKASPRPAVVAPSDPA